MATRTQRLKENVKIKAIKDIGGVEAAFEKKGEAAFRRGMGIKLCLDRPRLLTESYKMTEGEPMETRRAKGLAHILENMKIYIQSDELIVGNFASRPECVTTHPELQWRWLDKTIGAPDGVWSDLLSDEEKKEMMELHKYWKTLSIGGKERQLVPEEIKPYWYFKGTFFWTNNYELGTPDYDRLFSIGVEGTIKEADEKLKEIDKDYSEGRINSENYLNKKRFLEAAKIVLNSFTCWLKRYERLSREMAGEEENETRKRELEEISEICNWISEKPPRTLREAIQLFLFVHLVVNYIELPQVGCGIRADTLFYPFYKRDLENGGMTREKAQELLESLWVKFLETGFLHPPIWSGFGGGGLGWQTVTIGGVSSENEDVTNEMTYLVLESTKSLQTLQPPLALRVHDKTPRELLLKAVEVLGSGIGQPALFNDKAVIPRLLSLGFPLDDALNYSINNCMVPTIPGKNLNHRSDCYGWFNVAKCLELALNQGKDFKTEEQLSIETPDPSSFVSIEEIEDAITQHFRFNMHKLVMIGNMADALYKEYLPRPFLSAVTDGCIERAQDVREWNYEPDYREVVFGGVNNVADSLAAIKKLVFEEQRIGMAELVDVLKKNWEGKEDIRQMFINDAPKFGNDDDYVDAIAKKLFRQVADETMKFKTIMGTSVVPDGTMASGHFMLGDVTNATPDGRKAGEALPDGSVSPVYGRDQSGPTAALRSVSKADAVRSFNHLFNQTFMPQFMKGEYVETFVDYLRTWADLGIHHIQFNVVGRDTLRDAQSHPEEHSDLIVRVAGYSAYFIDLSKKLQETIIDRTQQSFC